MRQQTRPYCARPGCNRVIPPRRKPEAIYCSNRCRDRVHSARYRERQRLAGTTGSPRRQEFAL